MIGRATGCILADLPGYTLTVEDKELLQHPLVAGIILFSKNYENPSQLTELTKAIRKIRNPFIIAVDQEGGRVQRFINGFTRLPSMQHWGGLFYRRGNRIKEQLAETIKTACAELKACGVNVNLSPVLDINHKISKIIGRRSFHHDPNIVAELANVVIETMQANHMPATGKHFPGHGGVLADSHKKLPIDNRSWEEIENCDLLPYAKLCHKLDAIMPSHIVYAAMDENPSGFSSFWIQKILRKRLNFNGVVISDDLTMKGAAAFGNYAQRAILALEAGCDLLSVCNNRSGEIEVIQELEKYKYKTQSTRIQAFLQKLI